MALIRPAAILLSAALIIGCAYAQNNTTNTAPPTPGDTAALYQAKCQSCHGADGKGQTYVGKRLEVKNFTSPEVLKMSEFELFRTVREGKGKMPAYDNKLTGDQILALVRYARKLK